MWPLLQEGDVLVLEPVAPPGPRRGDVVAFSSDGEQPATGQTGARPEQTLTVHRVVGGTAVGALTRGDARSQLDDRPVGPEQIAGLVVKRIRLGRVMPVAGGWRGVIAGRVLGTAGRVTPGRGGRGSRVADGVLLLCSPLSRVMRPLLSVADTPEGGGRVLYLGRQPIGVRESEETGAWRISWPYSLLIPHTVGHLRVRPGKIS